MYTILYEWSLKALKELNMLNFSLFAVYRQEVCNILVVHYLSYQLLRYA